MAIFHLFIATCALFILVLNFIYNVRAKRLIFSKLLYLERRMWDDAALLSCAQTDGIPLPYHGEWRATPDFIAPIVSHIRKSRPSLVVELGSGVSTYWIAKALSHNGTGRLISIDHDERFMLETKSHIYAAGMSDVVEFRFAPLGGEPLWYNRSEIENISDIDVLVVDGPPVNLGADRAEAVKFFCNRLSDEGSIYFDDASRLGDRCSIEAALERAERFEFTFLQSEKGICIAKLRVEKLSVGY